MLLPRSLVKSSQNWLKGYLINLQSKDLLTMSSITLNLLQGSVTFSFTPEAAKNLQQEIAALMDSLKAIALHTSGGRPTPQQSMEYTYAGDVFIEVFCNPNIYPSPFAAKVLLTIRDDRVRLNGEAELTRLIEDLDRYLEENN